MPFKCAARRGVVGTCAQGGGNDDGSGVAVRGGEPRARYRCRGGGAPAAWPAAHREVGRDGVRGRYRGRAAAPALSAEEYVRHGRRE